jgi:ATP-dependent helicase HrpB
MADNAEGALPIIPFLPEIARALLEAGALVLQAAPGAGKTSLVPQAIAEAAGGKVLVMEPRRVAALSAAARIAELWGKRLGDEVGYRVRGDSRSGPRARVEAVTPGVLVRMIQDDPGLEGASCVVLDEFHERSAQADLALALLAQSRELRRESGSPLLLLAMSATMDCAKAAAALRAPLLDVPGRAFPVDTRHERVQEGRGFEEALASLAHEAMREADGDVLAFLPGLAEIGRAEAAFAGLARSSGTRYATAILHGAMPLEAQRRVLMGEPGSPRRAVFATSVAETSLTVPRVRAVVDSGQARLSRFEPRTGLNRLVTEREARDRADQRRGRAGRLGPGLCIRAWAATESLAERTEPELSRAELSAIVLEAALWGAPRRLDLAWLDPPPEGAWAAGAELLVGLGALAPSLAPTAFGRRMAALGTEPRLAALVLRGLEAGEGWTACLAAALLSERGASPGSNDIGSRIEGMGGRPDGPALAEARRLARAAGIGTEARPRASALPPLLAAAFPDRIGALVEREGGRASFRIPAGRLLKATGELAAADWIVAVEADAGAEAGRIYSGSALSEAEARERLEAAATEDTEIEWKGLEPRAARVRRAGAIVLARRPAKLRQDEAAALLAARVSAEGLSLLPWEGGASEELARLRFFAGEAAEARAAGFVPSGLADEALAASAGTWLGPYVEAGSGALVDGRGLERAVSSLAPRALRAAIERLAPKRLELPSGSSRPIDYRGYGGPSVEARAQEFFGMSEHPRVCGRALVVRLLDPGGKPLQVSSDLPGFWRGSWAEARKQLRGRYPKHEWPEDPSRAEPSRSGIRKKGR